MTGLLTILDAARLLGVSDSRVKALIRSGRLPAEKFGRAWVIREQDLSLIAHRPTGRPRLTTPGV